MKSAMMDKISWEDFLKVELRAGTIIEVSEFPEARKPAYKVRVDLGDFGIKSSSAQITHHYNTTNLMGKQVVCVVNFPPKRIASFVSEVLITGFADGNGDIVLITPDVKVPNGSRLF